MIATIVFSPIVLADVIPVGYKGVGYCFEVSNMEDYPEYVLISYIGEPMGGHKVIEQGECVRFYKHSRPTVYAIKRIDFNETEIGGGYNETEIEYYENEEIYFESNQNLIPSHIEIRPMNLLPENDQREKVVDVLEIVSLSENNFELIKSKVIYTYEDGTIEEIPYENQETRPDSPREPILPWWFSKLWYIVLPLVAITAIILLIRKYRK